MTVHNKNLLFSCDKCGFTPSDNKQMSHHFRKCSIIQAKENLEMPNCNILCSKCNVQFCSQKSLELHFNCCEGPEIEMVTEKLPVTIVGKFSCSKCDMDFNLEEALKGHSESCKIALKQPGEAHFDHTYSKDANLKLDLFCHEQILSLESDQVETEVKEEKFEDDSTKSEAFLIKTEFKVEVKEEAYEEFNANEQIGMDFITSKDFDTSIQSSVKTEVKTGVKAEVKEEAYEEFNANEQIGVDFITSNL